MNKPVTQPTCTDCSTNPALLDDSLGIKWVQGGVMKAYPCGCTIEGRGLCNFPLHIHYCATHSNNEMLAANVRLLLQYMSSPEEENQMEQRAQVATDGNVSALEAILGALRNYLPTDPTPKPTVKTYADWNGSGKDLSQFLQVGDAVDDQMAWYFLEVLPPATNLTNLIQIGEPYSHVQGRPTFSTLHRENGQWIYRGHCHRGQHTEPADERNPIKA